MTKLTLQLVTADQFEWFCIARVSEQVTAKDLRQAVETFKPAKQDIRVDDEFKSNFSADAKYYGTVRQLVFQADELWAKVDLSSEGLEMCRFRTHLVGAFMKNSHDYVGNLVGTALVMVAFTNSPSDSLGITFKS